MMRVPIRISFSQKCKRCGLRYPEKASVCPHCEGLTDDQVRRIRLRHQNSLAGHSSTGRLFMYIAGLIIVVLVIYMLNNR